MTGDYARPFFQCPSDDHIKDGRTCEGDGEVCI